MEIALYVTLGVVVLAAIILFAVAIKKVINDTMSIEPAGHQVLDPTGIPMPTTAGRPKMFADIDKMDLRYPRVWPTPPLGRRTDPVSDALGTDAHNASSGNTP